MKFAAILFWWQHRRRLQARGYSLVSFCEMTISYWRSLAQDPDLADSQRSHPAACQQLPFSRDQLRARW